MRAQPTAQERLKAFHRVDLHGWTPVRDRGMRCRQYTPSSHATTPESNKSVILLYGIATMGKPVPSIHRGHGGHHLRLRSMQRPLYGPSTVTTIAGVTSKSARRSKSNVSPMRNEK